MILHQVAAPPKGNWDGEERAFGEYDIARMRRCADIDEAWYWYRSGSYDGAGQILMRVGELFYLHDAGHCSCKGPTDDISLTRAYKSLAEIEGSGTDEWLVEIRPLLEAARSAGWE